jgi:putative FmdB family regulatory protein
MSPADGTGDARMPLYSYSCRTCDKAFELLVRSGEVPACPACGGEDLQRLVSHVAQPGKLAGAARAARAQAGHEGHLSNFSRSERRR